MHNVEAHFLRRALKLLVPNKERRTWRIDFRATYPAVQENEPHSLNSQLLSADHSSSLVMTYLSDGWEPWKLLEGAPEGTRIQGRARDKWKDGVRDDLQTPSARLEVASGNRSGWRSLLQEANNAVRFQSPDKLI